MAVSKGVVAALLFAAVVVAVYAESEVASLQIGVKHKPETCHTTAKQYDKVALHYRGTLLKDGSEFDSSYSRNSPFQFQLGTGQVIKGWDQGILGMCVGEKRILKIPSDMAYGDRGFPPKIPGGASLKFEVEMISIQAPGYENVNY